MNRKINVLDIDIDNCSAKEALKKTIEYMDSVPVNTVEMVTVDGLMQMDDMPELKDEMWKFDLLMAGDKTILEAADVTEKRYLQEAEDQLFLRMFLRYLHKNHKRVYLLVESEEEGQTFFDYLQKHYDGVQVVGLAKVSATNRADDMLVNAINGGEVDCVIAALLAPLQEDFIIKNTLSKFPDEEAMVRENLDKNRPSQATTAKVEKNISASKNDNNFSIAMLDTSVYGLDNIFEILEEYAREGKILGITDVVLEELANLQKTMDTKGKCACNFLYIIMDNLSAFQLFEVKHNMLERETIDEAIIRATLDLGKKALLLTSDKEMYIKAALKGVKAKYLLSSKKRENKFEFNLEETREKSKEHKKIKAKTFIDAHEENGKLFFIRKKRKTQLVKIFSKSGEEKYGDKIELEIGDHVFICTKREDYIRFLDYEVYFLKEDGFLERYSTKSYNCDVTVNVENHDYKKVIEQARKTLIK